jgi:hypothetical protein
MYRRSVGFAQPSKKKNKLHSNPTAFCPNSVEPATHLPRITKDGFAAEPIERLARKTGHECVREKGQVNKYGMSCRSSAPVKSSG